MRVRMQMQDAAAGARMGLRLGADVRGGGCITFCGVEDGNVWRRILESKGEGIREDLVAGTFQQGLGLRGEFQIIAILGRPLI